VKLFFQKYGTDTFIITEYRKRVKIAVSWSWSREPEVPKLNCLPEPEPKLRIATPAPAPAGFVLFTKDLKKFYGKKNMVAEEIL
jgi:hypothetical protein